MSERPDDTVAVPAGAKAGGRKRPSIDQLLEPMQTPLPRQRVGLRYRLGLLIVTLTMVLLPAVYLALICLIGFLVYLHAVENIGIIEHGPRGRGIIFVVAIYVAPLVAGPVAIFFMFKPFFARRIPESVPLSVEQADQPGLFAFVSALCACVAAPKPRQIDVDCQVNASAGLRRGLLSLFGRDLVLTIGLPLVSGLNLRQLAGVLAHEFGHFSQGGGMRLTYIIRRISGWFERVVYQRDQWDQKLVDWTEESPHLAVSIVLWVTKFMVWLSRRVLWVLMWIGHVISCFMLRRMEYDADGFEARFAGSEAFESTALQLPMLGAAQNAALSDLRRSYGEGKLADDLPSLVSFHAGRIPTDVQAQIREGSLERKTGWLDTHPADRDRIAAARRLDAPGVFDVDAPATVLFKDYGQLCRLASAFTYRHMLGPDYEKVTRVPTRKLIGMRKADESAGKASERFFQGFIDANSPIWPPPELRAPVGDPRKVLAELREARKAIIAHRDKGPALTKQLEQADDRVTNLNTAWALQRAGFTIEGRHVDLPSGDPDTLRKARSEAVGNLAKFRETHQQLASSAQTRLALAL